MFADQEAVRPDHDSPTLRPGPEGPLLRVHLRPEGHPYGTDARVLMLRPDHWERLKIDLPEGWDGRGLRLEPGEGLGLLEIAGVRIVSRVLGRTLWELLGRDLINAVRATPATQLVSSSRRLRLLCTDGDTQLWLPEVKLPGDGEPLALEIGLRVRTGLPQITHVLHAWVEEADTSRHASAADAAWMREERDREMGIAREYLTALEMARTDGGQREGALKQQLAAAHADAKQHADTLRAEIDAARADADRREAALREQMAAARQKSEQHTATLRQEIDNARAHGDERAAHLERELTSAREHGEQTQAQLHEATGRWQQSEHALADLRQHHEAMRVALAAESTGNATNQGRVRSMQQSFSWKVTLPLRAIGRLLTGRKTTGSQKSSA